MAGAATPFHVSLLVCPDVALNLILIPLSSVCSAPVMLTPVASVDEKLFLLQLNVSGEPVPSIFT